MGCPAVRLMTEFFPFEGRSGLLKMFIRAEQLRRSSIVVEPDCSWQCAPAADRCSSRGCARRHLFSRSFSPQSSGVSSLPYIRRSALVVSSSCRAE